MTENPFEKITNQETGNEKSQEIKLTTEEVQALAEKLEKEHAQEVNPDSEGINKLLKEMGFATKDQFDEEDEEHPLDHAA